MRIHWLQHVPFEGLGSIADWAVAHGCPITGSRLFAGGELPSADAFDMLVIMGGPMSVHDERANPWLTVESQFIARAIDAGKLILGICLGAQLIAGCTGARVYANTCKEIGWFPVELTRAAQRSAVGRALRDRTAAFHWHGETFEIPKGAVHLARSQACDHQAFAIGRRIVGLQYHLETTAQSASDLISHCGRELVEAPYVQTERSIRADPERFARLNADMNRLMDYFRALHAAGPDGGGG